jgi:hypothetical protein
MRKQPLLPLVGCAALIALAGCATMRDSEKPWVATSNTCRPLEGVVTRSAVNLGHKETDDGRLLSTYLVTVILKVDAEKGEACLVTYKDHDAYDVVTPLSAVKVGSTQITYLVVRNSTSRDPGRDPPPPP